VTVGRDATRDALATNAHLSADKGGVYGSSRSPVPFGEIETVRTPAMKGTEGKTMKQVACVLNVSTSTVAFHKIRIKKILHARTYADLVQHAIETHLIVA
jgi:hypothetical protein